MCSHVFANVSKDVDFYLWTRENPISYDHIKFNESLPNLLNSSHFSPSLPTKILIHGYGDTGTTDWVIDVKNKYLFKGEIFVN